MIFPVCSFLAELDEAKKIEASINNFCVSKENCRRLTLLNSIGSSEVPDHIGAPCCDVCGTVPDKLSFEVAPTSHKRRKALREVDKDLKSSLRDRLAKERDLFVEQHPLYKMIGREFVCASAIIEDIVLMHILLAVLMT